MNRLILAVGVITLAACGDRQLPIGPGVDFTGTYCMISFNAQPLPAPWDDVLIIGGAVHITRDEGGGLSFDDEIDLFDGENSTRSSLTNGPGRVAFETSRTLLLGTARAEVRGDSMALWLPTNQANAWTYRRGAGSCP